MEVHISVIEVIGKIVRTKWLQKLESKRLNERKPAEKLVIQKKIDPKGKSVNKSVDE